MERFYGITIWALTSLGIALLLLSLLVVPGDITFAQSSSEGGVDCSQCNTGCRSVDDCPDSNVGCTATIPCAAQCNCENTTAHPGTNTVKCSCYWNKWPTIRNVI